MCIKQRYRETDSAAYRRRDGRVSLLSHQSIISTLEQKAPHPLGGIGITKKKKNFRFINFIFYITFLRGNFHRQRPQRRSYFSCQKGKVRTSGEQSGCRFLVLLTRKCTLLHFIRNSAVKSRLVVKSPTEHVYMSIKKSDNWE